MQIRFFEWSDEEAQKWFKLIEDSKGKNEWIDVDWKELLCWEDTGATTNNTTQRAISGFANTYGGSLIVGFAKDGRIKGYEYQSDIENAIQRRLEKKLSHIPLFKSKYYTYNGKDILIIFIERSKKPIRCDDGKYYYRTQSEFRIMSAQMLESKFLESFEEEKYLYLCIKDLESLLNLISSRGPQVSKLSHTIKNFLKSQEKLYYFYKSKNLLEKFNIIRQLIDLYVGSEGDYPVIHSHELDDFKEQIKRFLNELKESVELNGKNKN